LVFCGTAPGHVSARAQAYYAHKQNKFWPTLHAVGLTPRLFAPHDYPRLLDLGIGLTDLCKHASGMDHELPKDAFDVEALRAKLERYAPRLLAFTSLNGGRAMCGRKAVYGPQPTCIGDTELWIVPSPSPAAVNAWTIAPWKELAMRVRGRSAPAGS
jgi:double-stranded uracil-DNA glycosylase